MHVVLIVSGALVVGGVLFLIGGTVQVWRCARRTVGCPRFCRRPHADN